MNTVSMVRNRHRPKYQSMRDYIILNWLSSLDWRQARYASSRACPRSAIDQNWY